MRNKSLRDQFYAWSPFRDNELHDKVDRLALMQINLNRRIITLMTALDDQLSTLNAGLAEVSATIGKVSADTDNLLAQLANFPPAGLTPEQQAALDAATASVTSIRDSLAALDAKVPEPVPPPEPTP